jgi:hypothetical protein
MSGGQSRKIGKLKSVYFNIVKKLSGRCRFQDSVLKFVSGNE